VFPVRYELNLYILFKRNSVFKGLNQIGFSRRSLASTAKAEGFQPLLRMRLGRDVAHDSADDVYRNAIGTGGKLSFVSRRRQLPSFIIMFHLYSSR
jgi:hypothetical protein